MANRTSTQQEESGSTSRRVAEALHERIDEAADKGEELERRLHEKSGQVQDKSRELNGTVTQFMHERPWTVVGGALALGVLIGALTRR